MKKAILVNVFRDVYGDCTNNGVSSKFNNLLVICDDGWIDVDFSNPPENLCVLRTSYYHGKAYNYIEPLYGTGSGYVGWMMGGNYAASCDSRWSNMIGGSSVAIPIHDRRESTKEYASYD